MQQRERQEEEVEKEEVGEERRRRTGRGRRRRMRKRKRRRRRWRREEDGSTVDHHLHQWLSHWSGEWEPPPAVGAGPRKGNIPFYTQLAASQMNQTSDFEVRRIVHVAAAVMTSITELKLSSPVVII